MFNYTKLSEDQADFYEILDVNELPAGQQMFFSIGDANIVLFNLAGAFYAIADVCSHDNGPVGEGEIIGTEIKCPRHGARFDLTTGEALSMPATVDIPAYPVRVQDGKIEVGLPHTN
jgi:3-phenylpropionate/trans-cinnamate dioxygenase ferredoxin component